MASDGSVADFLGGADMSAGRIGMYALLIVWVLLVIYFAYQYWYVGNKRPYGKVIDWVRSKV